MLILQNIHTKRKFFKVSTRFATFLLSAFYLTLWKKTKFLSSASNNQRQKVISLLQNYLLSTGFALFRALPNVNESMVSYC